VIRANHPPLRARLILALRYPGECRSDCARDERTLTYFLRRAPDRFAARKEIPARMAFCCTAAAVRPSFFAT
jgi:hypothetical protein